jgi:hypothetical protein
MGEQVAGTVSKLWNKSYTKAASKGDFTQLVYDSTMTGLIVEGGARMAVKPLVKLTTYVAPKGVPTGAIVKEISTGRIATPEALSKNYAEAINKVEQLASTKGGKFTGNVPIEGTNLELRYLKTPMQQVIGDVLFHGTKDEVGKPSLLRIAEQTREVVAGKQGLYTDPWAAIGYTRGGTNPGVLMIVTDASKIKSGVKGLSKGLTQSDAFIKGASEGFYGSSKVWRGDLETEIVASPGTKFSVPSPKADLITRLTVGKYADFFTSDGSKFVPIKLALDAKTIKPETIVALKSPANLYAVKLYSMLNALRDTSEALKRPNLVLKDVAGTVKEVLNFERYLREGTGGSRASQFPGVRDVYLTTSWGKNIGDIAKKLYNDAFKKTKSELGSTVRTDSKRFRESLERNMDDAYRANADAIVRNFRDVSKAYAASTEARKKFESAYVANLGIATESLAKSSDSTISTLGSLSSSLASVPNTARVADSVTRSIIVSDRPLTSVGVISTPTTETITEYPATSRVTERPVETPATITSRRPPETSPVETPLTSITTTTTEIRTPPTETPPTTEIVTPPESPPIETPPDRGSGEPTPPPPVISRTRIVAASPAGALVPVGSIVWKQGELSSGKNRVNRPVWKYIPPDDFGKDVEARTLMYAPHGVKILSGSPAETLQIIEGSRKGIPKRVNVNVGWADVTVVNGKDIEFVSTESGRSKSDKANKNISAKSGTLVSDITDADLSPDDAEGYNIVNRAKMSKKAPPRKGSRKISDWDYMTTLKGFRF